MISPTIQQIRGNDNHGSGAFKAPRGRHIHKGVDFICYPGQPIYMPIDGVVVREARPYPDGNFSGCLIESPHMDIKMFYFKPREDVIGKHMNKGDVIGTAQDISERYPGITPHIHLEIVLVDPTLFLNMP